MDFEKIKDFSRKGHLPKDLATCKTLICPFCIQAKQTRRSISGSATGRHIKASNLKPEQKVSCDHYISREPGYAAGYVANIHG